MAGLSVVIMNTTGEHTNTVLQNIFRKITIVSSLSIVFLISLTTLGGIILYRIYMKNKYSLEPLHIYLLNYVAGYTLRLAFGVMRAAGKHEFFDQEYCPYYFFGLFTITFYNIDIMLMQIDRFLAIYWNSAYKSRITATMATRSCIMSKSIAAVVTFLVFCLDQTYNKCSEPFAMFHLKKTNIYVDAYPSVAVAIIFVANSIYMAITIVKLDKKVNHHVSLPTLTTVSANVAHIAVNKKKDNFEQENYEIVKPSVSVQKKEDNIFQKNYIKD